MSADRKCLSYEDVNQYTFRIIDLISSREKASLLAIDQAGDPTAYSLDSYLPKVLSELEAQGFVTKSGFGMSTVYRLTEAGHGEIRKPPPSALVSFTPFHRGTCP